MTNNLPAALASALFAFSPEGADAINAAKRAAYIEALKRHDWLYEFSEDPLVLNRGREQSAQLRLAQRELDADWTLWNQHCAPLFKVRAIEDADIAAMRGAGL